MKITDKRNHGDNMKFEFNGALTLEQEESLKAMKEYENGILQATPAFGKTVVACKLIADRNVNTLIIVNKLELLRQWKARLKEFLNVQEVGQIGGGKNVVTNVIDVASIKTLWNNGKINDVVKNYGMIIIDECHHSAAFTYETAINRVNAKYVYGLTATPEREDGHTPIIKMQCGDIRYKVDSNKFNKELNIPMKVIVKESVLTFVDSKINNYAPNEINDKIEQDILRSEKILEDIKEEFNMGKNILVLTERLKHLEYFKDKLEQYTDNLFVYKGGMGKKLLKKYKEKKQKIAENNENKIILATGSYIGEGFDDPSLDVLFLTMPISGKTRVIQYTGRLHRKNDKKEEILVYDYVDKNFSQTRNMFLKRKKRYEELGYEIVDDRASK